jgi:hypothetical protein
MRSDTGWYLLAAGVLALGVSGSLTRAYGEWARDLVARNASNLQQVVSRADSYLAMAEMILGSSDQSWTRAVQSRLDYASRQAQMARSRVQASRAQMERVQRTAIGTARRSVIRCASMNNAHVARAFVSSPENF